MKSFAAGIARILQFLVLLRALVLPALLHAQAPRTQQFVYTNDNTGGGRGNYVSAFSVSFAGVLAEIPGSPFATGGFGTSGFSFNYVGNTIRVDNGFLFVGNYSDVSVFSVASATGALTLVPGSPFSTGGISQNQGLSLAVSPNHQFLYVGNGGSNNLSAFRIAPNGALTLLRGFPRHTPGLPADLKVSPNGQFLYVLLPSSFSLTIGIYQIAASGQLTALPGSPFATTASQGLDIDCAGSFLFASEGTGKVDVFSIADDGTLAAIPGSPFGSLTSGGTVLLNSKDDLLFVSDEFGQALDIFSVAADGSLTAAPGSPFTFLTSGEVLGLAAGSEPYLFSLLTGMQFGVASFRVLDSGKLVKPIGSPFTVRGAINGSLTALAAYPPKTCK